MSRNSALFIGVPSPATIAKMWSRWISLAPACTARGTWYWVSSTISLILRPWTPPLSLSSSNRIFTAFVDDTPYVAAGPERSVCIPSTISVLLTLRVSFWATASPASATAPTSTPAATSRILIARSFRSDATSGPRRRRAALRLGVHGLDHVLVLSVDERALELHRRRELLVLRGEDLLDQPELLDGLDPRQLPIDAVDLAPDQALDLLSAAERGEVRERYVALLRELGDGLVVDHHQAGQELPLVADDHGVGDVRGELELVLDLRRGDVLAARGDDDVLHPVRDPHEPLGVHEPDVAGVKPAIDHRLGGLHGIVVIPEEHVGTLQQDLALGRDADLRAGTGDTHRAELDVIGRHGGGEAAVLGLAVDLAHVDTERHVPLDQVRRDRRGAGGGAPGAVQPHRALDVVEHEEVGDPKQQAEAQGGPPARDAVLGDSRADRKRPVVGESARTGRVAHPERDRRVVVLPVCRQREE